VQFGSRPARQYRSSCRSGTPFSSSIRELRLVFASGSVERFWDAIGLAGTAISSFPAGHDAWPDGGAGLANGTERSQPARSDARLGQAHDPR
jgi:hypothetical protein